MKAFKAILLVLLLSLGAEIQASELDNILQSPLVGDNLKRYVVETSPDKDEAIEVLLGLVVSNESEPTFKTQELLSHKNGKIDHKFKVNDKFLNDEEVENFLLKIKQDKIEKQLNRQQKIKTSAQKFNEKMKWLHDESMSKQVESGSRTIRLSLTMKEISKVIKKVEDEIIGIELFIESENTISQAMASTRTNQARFYTNAEGSGVGIYMTEHGCPRENFDNNFLQGYIRLSGSADSHAENVASIVRHVSPESFLYCRGSAVLPQASDLDGVAGNPPIKVATRSNAYPTGYEYRLDDRDWDNLVFEDKVLAFISSGNNGNSSANEVYTPGKGYNVVTVGNYNDSNNGIYFTSSYGDSLLGNQKPEIVAPGVNISAGGHTFTGTSMSTPHAAAMAANLMSYINKLSSVEPSMYKAWMMAGATNFISGGYDATGLGGIDFVDAISDFDLWRGSNPSSYFPQGSSFDVPITISARSTRNSIVHIVVTWLVDGDHAYANRNNGNAMGKDFDIHIYRNGSLFLKKENRQDTFEWARFGLPAGSSNTYKVKIVNVSDTDPGTQVPISMAVVYERN